MAENREIVTHPLNHENPVILSTDSVQCLIQIGDNILCILDANGNPHETVSNS